jgi:hypothetical protein
MAESFEGKIISNPLANLRPQKMQYGAKVGGFGKVNRQEVFTTTVKAPMLRACIRTRIKTRRMISTQDLPKNTANAWFNGLTAQQKLLIIL